MAYDEYLQNGKAVLHVVTCSISADELEDEGPEIEVNILRSNNLDLLNIQQCICRTRGYRIKDLAFTIHIKLLLLKKLS